MLTVLELIEELKQCDPELLVIFKDYSGELHETYYTEIELITQAEYEELDADDRSRCKDRKMVVLR